MKLNPNVILDSPPASRFKGMSLIIENDPANSRLLASLLGRRGLNTVVAASPAEAISLWERHENEITLVIADASLQDETDGFEVARRLKTRKPGLNVILGSGYPRARFEAADLMEGVKFVAKPFNSSALVAILQRCLDHLAVIR